MTVVTMLVCSFYFACEAAGALGARNSLRPLLAESGTLMAKLARMARRDRERMFAIVAPKRKLDCFVASAFARRRASADKRAPRNDAEPILRLNPGANPRAERQNCDGGAAAVAQ